MQHDIDSETGEILPAVRQASPPILVPLASPSCAQVWGALSVAQGKFEAPKRTKEAKVEGVTKAGKSYEYKYKYAPLEEIERVIKGPLSENSLFRQQYLVNRAGLWMIRTVIGHSSGEWIACDYPIYASKDGAQGFASGVTYARRYGLSLALGLAPEDDDDAQIADSAPAQDAPTGRAGAPQTQDRLRQHLSGGNGSRPTGPPATSPAEARFKAIRAEIDAADTIDALNATGLWGETREADEALLSAVKFRTLRGDETAWDRLIERDTSRRMIIAGAEGDIVP